MAATVARLIGGAGTGKTRSVLEIMEKAIPAIGGDIRKLGFASFTRAARLEAVARASDAWGCDPDDLAKEGWFRTVHGAAYRAMRLTGRYDDMDLLSGTAADVAWLESAVGIKASKSSSIALRAFWARL